ncbi:MAG: cytochrome C oxidase subunit IV family protein [Aigarchaeota archaeon]|nr:cytochrome C oxidase subunit IV family protein [Candidatus Pelearchaeum maunauluense]
MRVVHYVAVWVGLVILVALELVVFYAGLPPAQARAGIIGLASVAALLVAVFYQHLIREPRGVATLYIAGLLAALGLIIGMVVSLGVQAGLGSF